MPDLSTAFTAVMQQRFDWWSANDSLSLMIDLAAAGVATSLTEYEDADEHEHGIYLSYNHGPDCEDCQNIWSIVFESVKGGTHP